MQTATRDEFIAAMRNVATSVSVVTTQGVAGRHGATVSAFCSVSADPPTLLVCLNAGSRIATCVEQNQSFCVNILPHSAAAVADRFAGKDDLAIADRFDGYDGGRNLANIPDVTALECQMVNAMREGSHMIFLGRVKDVSLGAGLPLTYFAGQYHPLAEIGGS